MLETVLPTAGVVLTEFGVAWLAFAAFCCSNNPIKVFLLSSYKSIKQSKYEVKQLATPAPYLCFEVISVIFKSIFSICWIHGGCIRAILNQGIAIGCRTSFRRSFFKFIEICCDFTNELSVKYSARLNILNLF